MTTIEKGDELARLPAELTRAAAIAWIDNNFGMLSGLPSATERLIACFVAGVDTSWENATKELLAEITALRQHNGATQTEKVLREALERIVASWDANTHQRERFVEAEIGSYWSPASAMVDSEHIANARAALSTSSPSGGMAG